MKATIHEVLEYGPIMASDPELNLLVTVNGAYVNLWVSRGDGTYSNTDCRANGDEWIWSARRRSASEWQERCEECLADWLRGDE